MMRSFSNTLQFARTPAYRFRQILFRHDAIEQPTKCEIECYRLQLRLLATMFPRDKVAYQIEGGMAVAMHHGNFFRRHGDVDAAVFGHQLHNAERQLLLSNYRLFSRNGLHAFEYAPWDVLQPVTADQILSRKRVKRLTAVKVDDQGRVDSSERLLPRFDLHIHQEETDGIRLDRGAITFPRDLFFQTRSFELDRNLHISVASLPLMYFYKLAGKRQRHQFDLRRLEQHEDLSEHDRERAYQIFADSRRSGANSHAKETRSKPRRDILTEDGDTASRKPRAA